MVGIFLAGIISVADNQGRLFDPVGCGCVPDCFNGEVVEHYLEFNTSSLEARASANVEYAAHNYEVQSQEAAATESSLDIAKLQALAVSPAFQQ